MSNNFWLGSASWLIKNNDEEIIKIIENLSRNAEIIVDTSTNYPINNDLNSLGKTLQFLLSIKRKVNFKILVKVGSVNNLNSSSLYLNGKYIYNLATFLKSNFGEKFYGLGIHWDNRTNTHQVNETIDHLIEIQNYFNARICLSGIDKELIPLYSRLQENKNNIIYYQVNIQSIVKQENKIKIDYLKKNFCNLHILGYNFLGGLKCETAKKFSSDIFRFKSGQMNLNEKIDFYKSIKKEVGFDSILIGPKSLAQANSWREILNEL